jgi:hypothetical protein
MIRVGKDIRKTNLSDPSNSRTVWNSAEKSGLRFNGQADGQGHNFSVEGRFSPVRGEVPQEILRVEGGRRNERNLIGECDPDGSTDGHLSTSAISRHNRAR